MDRLRRARIGAGRLVGDGHGGGVQVIQSEGIGHRNWKVSTLTSGRRIEGWAFGSVIAEGDGSAIGLLPVVGQGVAVGVASCQSRPG